MAKTPNQTTAVKRSGVDIDERKREQYAEALERRNAAQGGIDQAESLLAHCKQLSAVAQGRIDVLEHYFSNLRSFEPEVESFLMKNIESENDEIRRLNEEAKNARNLLSEHRKRHNKADRILARILEEGPDMQNRLNFEDDDEAEIDCRDNKSRAAGR